MVFCNKKLADVNLSMVDVTILILIDGFLQYINLLLMLVVAISHNPYFNRWFSAIDNNGQQIKA